MLVFKILLCCNLQVSFYVKLQSHDIVGDSFREETLWQSCYWAFALRPTCLRREGKSIWRKQYRPSKPINSTSLPDSIKFLFKIVANTESLVNSQKSLKIEPKQKTSSISPSFRFETMKIDSSRKRNQKQVAICALGQGMSRILRIIMSEGRRIRKLRTLRRWK